MFVRFLNDYKSVLKNDGRFLSLEETMRNFVLLLHGGYIDIWPYFRDLMHYLSDPILIARARFSGENRNSLALYHIASHSPDYVLLVFSLFFPLTWKTLPRRKFLIRYASTSLSISNIIISY